MAPQPPLTKAASGQPPLFKGIKYHIAPCIPFKSHENIRKMLNTHGAVESNAINDAEYIFTDSEGFEGANEVSFSAVLVRPQWIERSLTNKTRQDPKYFSPSPRAIFSTLVIATDQLPPGDVEAVVAGVQARGGVYREGLTRDVTHLLVLGPSGDKYATARKYADQTGIKIVMVHWFDDCCHLGQLLPEAPYEQVLLQAEEEMKNKGKDGAADSPTKKKYKPKLSSKARMIFGSMIRAQTPPPPPPVDLSAQLPPSSPSRIPPTSSSPTKFSGSSLTKSSQVKNYANNIPAQRNVWNGRRILLSRSLILSNDRRSMVETEVRRHGGVVVHPPVSTSKAVIGTSITGEEDDEEDEEDELESDSDAEEEMQFEIDLAERRASGGTLSISTKYKYNDAREAILIMEGEVDVFVTKYRSGLGYIAALTASSHGRRDVSIGTIPWLFFCHDSGSISPPTAQLLHYPVQRGFVEGIRGKQITISNYQGQARDYLKKLITIMAGPLPAKGPEVFTATLCRNTDYVIAGKLEGQKVDKASSWRLPIVNHLWLEDSFKDWKLASLTVPKYTRWSPNISYTELLPNCPIHEGNRGKDILAYLKADLDTVESEMADIGYDEAYIHHVHADNLDTLRRLLDAPDSAKQDEEPSASHAQIERELVGDEDTPMENADDPHSSPKKASRSRTASKSLTKGVSGTSGKLSSRNPSPVKKSTVKGEVVTSTKEMRSDYADEIRREVMEGFNQHLNQSTLDVSPSKGGPPLRSPWDPISRKKVAPLITNDTPPQKPTPKKAGAKESRGRKSKGEEDRRARELEHDDRQEEEPEGNRRRSIDLETKEQAIARYKRSKGKVVEHEVESSPSPSKRRPRDEPPSLSPSPDEIVIGAPPTRSVSRRSSTNDDEVEVERTVEKRAKRDIRTQESDEEFPVESIGNLMTRRAKVVGIRQGDKGKSRPEDDDDVKRRQSSAARRQQQDEDEGDDWSDQEKKPVSAKTNKVMKRLRDSISGKEDSKSPPKKKGHESTAKDDEKSPTKSLMQRKKSVRDQAPVELDSDSDGGVEQLDSKPSRKGTKRAKPVIQPADHSMSSAPSDSDQEEHVSNSKKIPRSKSTSVPTVDDQGPSHRARRGAATKATQLLRDKIMPDANNFADEFRRGKIRGEWEDSKKRKRDENDDDDRSKRRKSTVDSDAKASTSAKRAETTHRPGIRMATTKVQLTDDELNKMRRMGVQPVDDPRTCTHLVTNSILRTEKFLCALSVAPIIVKEKWVRDCLAKGRIVDDSEYHLWDVEGEKRFGIDLQETLTRARENGPHLFEGHMFYLSPNLTPVAYDTLRNAIDSAGGKSSKLFPNPRLLENHLKDKHFIGGVGDKAKSKQLIERSIPIYSQELVLKAILRQQLPDWHATDVLLDN